MDAAQLKPFIAHLAEVSARVILPWFNNPALRVELKADQTPVTVADRAAETALRAEIAAAFPEHGILGEELPDVRPDAAYTWVLDPIDGTKSFAAGCPLFGTLICLRQGTEPIWGAIHLPATGQLLIGNNTHCWLNDRLVRMRETADLAACTLLTTDPKMIHLRHSRAGWDHLVQSTGMYRSWGDCAGYALVASGGADIMCDPLMNLWDIAALLPVMRGAGAHVMNWEGGSAVGADSIVACHPRHAAAIQRLLNP